MLSWIIICLTCYTYLLLTLCLNLTLFVVPFTMDIFNAYVVIFINHLFYDTEFYFLLSRNFSA